MSVVNIVYGTNYHSIPDPIYITNYIMAYVSISATNYRRSGGNAKPNSFPKYTPPLPLVIEWKELPTPTRLISRVTLRDGEIIT